MDQFNSISEQYAAFVGMDPMRNHLHYPAIRRMLCNVRQKMILDVGCGDGLFDRILASEGAYMTAYDSGVDQIATAKAEQQRKFPRTEYIQYCVADATTYVPERRHYDAISVMVLPYASDPEALRAIFTTTYTALLAHGRFLSIVLRPGFDTFDTVIGNRRFHDEGSGRVRVEFLHPQTGETCFESHLTQFDKQTYENAARAAGFSDVEWRELQPSSVDLKPESDPLKIFGEDFWKTCIQEQPYAMFNACRDGKCYY